MGNVADLVQHIETKMEQWSALYRAELERVLQNSSKQSLHKNDWKIKPLNEYEARPAEDFFVISYGCNNVGTIFPIKRVAFLRSEDGYDPARDVLRTALQKRNYEIRYACGYPSELIQKLQKAK